MTAYPVRDRRCTMDPGLRGCNPVGVHCRSVWKITPSRRRPGPMSQLAWGFREGTVTETAQIQVLAEPWVPACAGMAKEARVEIAALLVGSHGSRPWAEAPRGSRQTSDG